VAPDRLQFSHANDGRASKASIIEQPSRLSHEIEDVKHSEFGFSGASRLSECVYFDGAGAAELAGAAVPAPAGAPVPGGPGAKFFARY